MKEYKIEVGTPLAIAILDNLEAQQQMLDLIVLIKTEYAQARFDEAMVLEESVKDYTCDCTEDKCVHCGNSSNKGWNDCRTAIIDNWNAQSKE